MLGIQFNLGFQLDALWNTPLGDSAVTQMTWLKYKHLWGHLCLVNPANLASSKHALGATWQSIKILCAS